VGLRELMVAIDFHSRKKNKLWKSMAYQHS